MEKLQYDDMNQLYIRLSEMADKLDEYNRFTELDGWVRKRIFDVERDVRGALASVEAILDKRFPDEFYEEHFAESADV